MANTPPIITVQQVADIASNNSSEANLGSVSGNTPEIGAPNAEQRDLTFANLHQGQHVRADPVVNQNDLVQIEITTPTLELKKQVQNDVEVGDNTTNTFELEGLNLDLNITLPELTGAGSQQFIPIAQVETNGFSDQAQIQVTGANAQQLVVDPTTGVVSVDANADLLREEDASEIQLTITVEDDGIVVVQPVNAEITLIPETEVPINTAPTIEAPLNLSVAENIEANTVIAVVNATDAEGAEITLSLQGSDANLFTIDGTGQIRVTEDARFDFEENAGPYDITVVASDGELTSEQSIVINLVDVNEGPSLTVPNDLNVNENSVAGTVVGQVIASDVDDGDSLTYTLSGDDAGLFDIDSNGQITVADGAVLNHENIDSLDVTVTVTDGGGLTASQATSIAVNNINEGPSISVPNNLNINENSVAGTVVGQVTASDVDAGDSLTYSLSGNDAGLFDIDSNGQITVADGAVLNHENVDSLDITVTVTDGGGLTASQATSIAVNDINEGPSITVPNNLSVNENSVAGTVVGQVTASDVDAGDSLTYSLSGDDAGLFDIDSNGQITVADGAVLNHENVDSLDVTVTVTDGGGLAVSQPTSIAVNDINEGPSISVPNNLNVNENSVSGTVVGQVSASDIDAGDSLTYSLSGDDAGLFDIDSNGQITVADGAVLNHENVDSLDVTVTVTDGGGLTASQATSISVNDVNEGPSLTVPNNLSVNENSVAGTVVGQVSASDVDDGDSLTYTLSGDDAGLFDIDSNGQITVADGATLNHEGVDSLDVTVTVTDGGGLTASQPTSIAVNDINEGPSISVPNNLNVNENSVAGTVVGQVTASDVDDGDSLTYSLSGDDAGLFDIDSNGQITVADGATLNHESVDSLDVTVTVTDGGGLTASQATSIAVNDVNEGPSISVPNNLNINENSAAGTVVGQVTASDVDSGDSLTYSLSGDDAGLFDIDSNGQITVADGAVLNHENVDSLDVTVTVTDGGGLTASQATSISVNDVNEGPSLTVPNNLNVNENSTAGTVVGQVAASDVDAGDSLTYSLSGDDAGLFDIDSNGQITVADGAVLNHENVDSLDVTVTVTDGSGLTASQPTSIAVNDINEGPSLTVPNNLNVNENSTSGTVVGQVAASDVDSGDSLTYSLSGDDAGLFDIDSNGQITVADGAVLNHENVDSLDVTVTVTDGGGLTASQATSISVNDINEGPSLTVPNNLSVNENSAAGTVVGQVTASDLDDGDSLTYSLSGDDAGLFDIDSNGQITVADGATLNHENVDSLDVTVTVTDGGGLTASQPTSIAVNDINEGPSLTVPSNLNVNENSVAGTVVGQVSASDVDAGDSLTYSLSGDDAGLFDIDSNGQITVADGVTLNHESVDSLDVTVTVTDGGGLTASQATSIAVNDINEGPSLTVPGNLNVNENSAAGTVVGQVIASDVDAGDSLTYSLSGDDAGLFDIDSNGQITVADGAVLNHESVDNLDITVTVTDGGGLTASQATSISVNDINEGPSISVPNNLNVNENSTAGTVVGQVIASDVDDGDSLTYSLSGDDAGLFDIDSNGQITVADGAVLNHESVDSLDVTVTVTDGGGLTASQPTSIAVNDINEGPSLTVPNNLSVNENSASGTVVGQVAASDVDSGDSLTYSLSGDDAGLFDIDSNGQITVADGAVLNHESVDSLDVTVTVTDGGGLTASQPTSIAVNDINEGPSISVPNNLNVNENSVAGTVVGQVTASDVDAGDSLIYSLSGDDAGLFDIDSNGQITVADGAVLNHESVDSLDVTVTVTDGGGLTASQATSISVNDINEGPSISVPNNLNVNENSVAGTVVGQVTASDVDDGDSLTYSLSGDDAGLFDIDSNGQITVADGAILNHESVDSLDVTVTVTDAGGLTASQATSIAVNDINEGPSLTVPNNLSVNENSTAGTVVGQVAASDVDAGDSLTYSLSGDDAGLFDIDSNGQITVADGAVLNHESVDSLDVTVTVTDGGGLTVSQPTSIAVNDINEGPSLTVPNNLSVNENSAAGTVVGQVTASDVDAGDSLTYSLSGDDAGLFDIDSNGQITVADGAVLNHENVDSLDVTVTVTDGGGLTASQATSISVNDINEGPSISVPNNLNVNENSVAGTVVGQVTASDVDDGDSLTYTLSGDDAGLFDIDSNGQITVADGAVLNHENIDSLDVTVTVTDGGGLTASQPTSIAVNDINEGPSISVPNNLNVNENSVAGTVVGQVTASDVDAGDSFTYSLSGDDAGLFDIDSNGQITVADGAVLNHESVDSLDVTVTVTDAGGLTASQATSIAVNDINEGPSLTMPNNLSVNENSTAGTVVGQVAASDVDAGDSLTYSLSGDDAGLFDIDSNGQITVADGATLNHENVDSLDVTVTVTDGGGLTASQATSISVNDINETPTDISADQADGNNVIEISADIAEGAEITQLSTADPDAGDSHTYELVDANGDSIMPQTMRLDDALESNPSTQISIDYNGTSAGAEGFNLTSMGRVTVEGQNYTVWRVRNINDDARTVTLDPVGSNGHEQRFEVPPNSDTYVMSVESQGAATHKLLYSGNQVAVKAASNNAFNQGQQVTLGEEPLFVIDGNAIVANDPDNILGGSEYQIYVKTTDAQGLTYTESFTVETLSEIYGTNQANNLTGTDQADQIYGLGGNDQIYGKAGDDVLVGGDGSDRLYGGEGDDLLIGGDGNDAYYGEAGDDTFQVSEGDDRNSNYFGGEGRDTIDVASGDLSFNRFDGNNSVEVIDAHGGNLTGTGANNTLDFSGTILENVDMIDAGSGHDTVTGSQADDTILGDRGRDFLDGQAGDDILDGGRGRDTLRGREGDDTLIGGRGHDNINGNEGADVFIIGAGHGRDTIRGGDQNQDASWVDEIRLQGLSEGPSSSLNGTGSWTMSINQNGGQYTVDHENKEIVFDQPTTGTIALWDGTQANFSEIDKVTW